MRSNVGTLTGLYIYPIKSARGIALDYCDVEKHGLARDRRMMIVDANDEFITQRNFSLLATISASFEGEKVVLSSARGNRTEFILNSQASARRRVLVWKDYVDAFEVGEAVSSWLSQELGCDCRLVGFDELSDRQVNQDFGRTDDQVAFADGFPLLITSTASLADLNAKLEIPLPMNRFRPNFVVDGFEPWDEDNWRLVLIGDQEFRIVKMCARCRVTTHDQKTGMRADDEPLRTLATFRQVENKAMFGMNAIPNGIGSMRIGATVQVLERVPDTLTSR